MMGKVLLHIFGLITVTTLCSGLQTPVTVNTNVGSIMGFVENVSIDGNQTTISKFLGIPFAESTAGVNKFKKPVPKAIFSDTYDARTESNSCYQGDVFEQRDIEVGSGVTTVYSDDCLRLNIYIPGSVNTNTPKPVMIWVYGGGFVQGTTLLYQPDGLVSYGDVIVVTVNYRVGMFGFLRDSQGHFPGNQGLWDQQLAIKWVYDNIESFNGMKDNITIFGQSAGSASVLFQAMYPGNRGLFTRVIAESGTPFSPWALSDVSISDQLITDQGCTSDDVVTCLQSKDSAALVTNHTYDLAPVVDNDFLVDTPSEIIFGNSSKTLDARTFFSSLDIIVGLNNQEGAAVLTTMTRTPSKNMNDVSINGQFVEKVIIPKMVESAVPPSIRENTKSMLEGVYFNFTDSINPQNGDSIKENATNLLSDALFYAGASRTVDGHAAFGIGRTYLYELGFNTSYRLSGVTGIKGWSHLDEIAYVFGYPLLKSPQVFGKIVNFTTCDQHLSETLITLWTNFAKSGDPTLPSTTTVVWPEYTTLSQVYLTTDQSGSIIAEKNFHPRRMWLWNEFIPSLIEKSMPKPTTQNPVNEIIVG